MAYATVTADRAPSVVARVLSALKSTRATWARNAAYKRTFNELDRLSNRELADIGIRRCDIEDIARFHVYGA
ncbi:DUF1127 domain-containing protein [Ruegeria pomeroyi]|uniref:DUF1127 domain-containing protein n=1 Tax=Ruegeria alba TaxID=2916756 RepID=A0ABS9P0D8_9RHOB|nr:MULTISPECIES: DUF1127 domain-containing protein [Ruegeria]MCE8510061.1 DUF1127 domain-containing protein [Ruegeria pomeroyi]MCE8515526.1 DUF1127 domain-containing protein [Ruegeria pomeroyi]MCE8527405.1 DUF1127 domain-containing protein [Ruegeria pomeroyi]MCE8556033.1 DUF1127 domain-containing protein [Ruegeria pomeroyi]MCG6559731.1 DUF1127 domain-containing protein [Ruegeria alba]